jgi:hypothetical protein
VFSFKIFWSKLHVSCISAEVKIVTCWKESTAEHNFNEVVEAIKATWHVFSSIFSLFFVCISKLKLPIGRIIPRQIILCAAQATRLWLVA